MKLTKQFILSATTVAVLAFAAGCNSNTPSTSQTEGYQDPFFHPEELATVDRVARQQAASAARADATLNGAHFHAGKLNSLGEQKLELMLEDDDDSKPIMVYIDVTEDADSAARRSSVEGFMLTRGIPADQLKVENGLNPRGSGTPAAQGLKNLSKTDSVGSAGASAGVSQ